MDPAARMMKSGRLKTMKRKIHPMPDRKY